MNSLNPPDTYNVYGYIYCEDDIKKVKKAFTLAFSLTDSEIYFDKGILKIVSSKIEANLEQRKDNRWALQAAIAGENIEVIDTVKKLAQQLLWFGFSSKHEIYDSGFNCIDTIEMR